MIFYPEHEECQTKAVHYFTNLYKTGKPFEIRSVKQRRSGQQNRYLHLLLGLFGSETGYTTQETKTILKRQICPDVFRYKKASLTGGLSVEFELSTSELNSAQMTSVIDRFRLFSSEELGIRLPMANEPSDYEMDLIQNQIER